MAENNDVPENTDKILFAKDLMNHAMSHAGETAYNRMTAERYRKFGRNAFSETIQEAVTFLYNKEDMEGNYMFLDLLRGPTVNFSTYITYAKKIKENYFTDGFDASDFLHYCVYLARLAVDFYKHGIFMAPDLAIAYIIDTLSNFDMTTGGWDTLNTVAEKFTNAAGGSSYLNEDFKEYEVQIQKASLEDYQARSNSSTENKEDFKESKKCYPSSSANSSNFEENCVMNGSSPVDAYASGTSYTTGISALSVKGDYLDLPLKEINLESVRNVPPPASEDESSMLEITSKYSDSEETIFQIKNLIYTKIFPDTF